MSKSPKTADFQNMKPTRYSSLTWSLFAFTGFFLSLMYGVTMCPTVPGGDSGELITVAYGLGVAHPPGYPLYTLIAHLFSYLPIGNIAFRINVLSAVFSVMGSLLLFHFLMRWLKDAWVASGVSIFFFLSPLVWRYSVVAEVFTLNILFILTLLFCFYQFLTDPKPKWVWAMAASLGFACSHHHTILFLAVPLFVWLSVFHFRSVFNYKSFLPSVSFFLLGFIPYLYIPWAAAKKDIFSWGQAEEWAGFWAHFLRKEYGTLQLATGGVNDSKMSVNLLKYGEDLLQQTLIIGLVPVLIGLWYLSKNRGKSTEFLRAVLWVFVFYTLSFNYLANMDLTNRLFFDIQSRFWIFPNLLLCFFMAYGLYEIKKVNFKFMKFVPVALALIYFPIQFSRSFNHEDYSGNHIFEDVGRSTLLSLPPNAVMFMRGDIYVNAVRYLQNVEGIRPDVKAIPLDLLWWPWMKEVVEANHPDVVLPNQVYRYERKSWNDFTLIELFAANIQKHPIFIGKLRQDEIEVIKDKYKLKNLGYINAVLPAGEELDFKVYRKWAKAFDNYVPPQKSDIRERSWEAFVYYNYWDREVRRIDEIFAESAQKDFELERLAYGAHRLEILTQRHPEPPVHVWKNLGVAYQFLGRDNPNLLPKMVDVWGKYVRRVTQAQDPDVIKIRKFLDTQNRATASE